MPHGCGFAVKILALVFFGHLLVTAPVLAGTMELSFGFNYNRTNYSEGNYSWNRRLGASVAYHFTATSGIEWSYAMVVDRTKIEGLQDTTFNDQVYSLNWVQSLTGSQTIFQPYFKAGIGQLNRDASGTYAGGVSPPPFLDALSAVLSTGFRLYFTKAFALRIEATTYLQNADFSKWKDNLGLTAGTSIYF